MSKGHQMIKDYVSNFKILTKKTLSFGNQKFSNSIEDIKDFRYQRSNNQRKKKRDYRKSGRNRNWVELVEISVKDIKQIQFQIKSDMKLDKKDVHFAEFSYL